MSTDAATTFLSRIEDGVEFRVADVQDLPFEADLFDAVIGESVIAFPENENEAVGECVRVTKPGGYVGFNEMASARP